MIIIKSITKNWGGLNIIQSNWGGLESLSIATGVA